MFLEKKFVLLIFFVVPRYSEIFYVLLFFLDFLLVSVVSSTRFNGGVLLGPLPIVPSASLVSVPNPHLCASSLVFSCVLLVSGTSVL